MENAQHNNLKAIRRPEHPSVAVGDFPKREIEDGNKRMDTHKSQKRISSKQIM